MNTQQDQEQLHAACGGDASGTIFGPRAVGLNTRLYPRLPRAAAQDRSAVACLDVSVSMEVAA